MWKILLRSIFILGLALTVEGSTLKGANIINNIRKCGEIKIDLAKVKWDSKIYNKKSPWVKMSYDFKTQAPDDTDALSMKIEKGDSWLRSKEISKGEWRKSNFDTISFMIKKEGARTSGKIYLVTDEKNTSPFYSYRISFVSDEWKKVSIKLKDFQNSQRKHLLDFRNVKNIQFHFRNVSSQSTVFISDFNIKIASKPIALTPVKNLKIYPTKSKPQLDGIIDDACWKTATVVDDFIKLGSTRDIPNEKTKVWITYDRSDLYIAARLYSEDTSKLKAKMKKRDDKVWQDDTFEVLFDVLNDYTCWQQFIVNSIETQQDIRFWWHQVADQLTLSPEWNGKWKAKVKVSPKFWDVEILIPFTDLENKPGPGKYIGVQFGRENQTLKEYSTWTPTDRFCKPNNFGVLNFCSDRKVLTKITSVSLNQVSSGNKQFVTGQITNHTEGFANIKVIITNPYQKKYSFSQKIKLKKGNNKFLINCNYSDKVEGRHTLAVVCTSANSQNSEVYLAKYNLHIPSPIKYGDIVLCPKPKETKFSNKIFSFSSSDGIYIRKNASPKEKNVAELLQKDIYGFFGKKLQIISKAPQKFTNLIYLGKEPDWKSLKTNKLLPRVAKLVAEGYGLEISDKNILIKGKDSAGLYYGLMTLSQLMRYAVLKEKDTLQAVKIIDWPDLKMRVVHNRQATSYGRHFRDFKYEHLKSNILRLLAGNKINHFAFMSENGIGYEMQQNKKLIRGPLMTMKQYSELADFCRKNYIEFIPALHSASHHNWMLDYGYPQLQEGEDHWQGDVLHPDFYKALFPVFEELIQAAKPKYFHVEQDEWWHKAKVESTRKGIPRKEIYYGHIKKLHDFLKKRNIRQIMFCDMISKDGNGGPPLNVSDIAKKLPKDIIMNNWSGKAEEINNYGFDQIIVDNGFRPISPKDKSLISGFGVINTGSLTSIRYKRLYFYCFHNLLRAADYAWNINHDSDLPLQEWFRIYGKNIVAMNSINHNPFAGKKFSSIDLSASMNANHQGNDNFDGFCLFQLKPGKNKLGFIDVEIVNPKNNKGKSCLIMKKEAVDISVKKKLSSLIFLQTAILPEKLKSKFINKTSAPQKQLYGTVIGKYKVIYEDGTEKDINIRYGLNVNNWVPYHTPSRVMFQNRFIWDGKTRDGKFCSAYLYEWVNPFPQKEIKELKAISSGTEAVPVLLAITGRSVKK